MKTKKDLEDKIREFEETDNRHRKLDEETDLEWQRKIGELRHDLDVARTQTLNVQNHIKPKLRVTQQQIVELRDQFTHLRNVFLSFTKNNTQDLHLLSQNFSCLQSHLEVRCLL